jgi:hypothetical protein
VTPEQELEQLEALIEELLAGIQEALQSGETLSDEFQGQIADELEAATSRIDQLRSQQAPPSQPPQSPGGALGAPPAPDVQLLWILSGQQEQPFLQYLQTYPTPATQALLANPPELTRVINFLNQMMPPGEQPSIHGIQHADLNSSNIWGTNYNPKKGKMRVRFQGGSEYEYDGVPANIYKAFTSGAAAAKTQGSNQYGAWWVGKNPSLGAAMNQYIKAGNFPYRRLN